MCGTAYVYSRGFREYDYLLKICFRCSSPFCTHDQTYLQYSTKLVLGLPLLTSVLVHTQYWVYCWAMLPKVSTICGKSTQEKMNVNNNHTAGSHVRPSSSSQGHYNLNDTVYHIMSTLHPWQVWSDWAHQWSGCCRRSFIFPIMNLFLTVASS